MQEVLEGLGTAWYMAAGEVALESTIALDSTMRTALLLQVVCRSAYVLLLQGRASLRMCATRHDDMCHLRCRWGLTSQNELNKPERCLVVSYHDEDLRRHTSGCCLLSRSRPKRGAVCLLAAVFEERLSVCMAC
jgi:hypothetical protein